MKRLKQFIKENEERWLGTGNPERVMTDHSDNSLHHSGAFQKLRDDKIALHDKHPLTEHEASAIDNYTGSLYRNLNKHHRGQEVKEYTDPVREFWHIPEFLNGKTKRLDSALEKHTTNHNAHVWRGVDKEVINNLKAGDTFHDKGYVSTTLRPRTATVFGSNEENNVHVMHIKLPKGSHALAPDNYPETGPMGEHEVILPRNSKFHYEGKSIYSTPDVVGTSGTTYKGRTYHIHHVTHIGIHND